MWYEIKGQALQRMPITEIPEWSLANGIGGYVSGTANGMNLRKHHALLVASLVPPVQRLAFLSKIEETIVTGNDAYTLSSQVYRDGDIRNETYLNRFRYEQTISYEFQVGEITVKKEIAPFYGHNAVAINYTLAAKDKASTFVIKPLFNWRDHGGAANIEAMDFTFSHDEGKIRLSRKDQPSGCLSFHVSEGKIQSSGTNCSAEFRYDTDIATGDNRTERHFTPYVIEIALMPFKTKTVGVVAAYDSDPDLSAEDIILDYKRHVDSVINISGFTDTFSKRLAVAADQFIARRHSTDSFTILAGFPWFTDWGRDTMIAFSGLLLATKRFAEARSVLNSFSRYQKHGLIPNMFPDNDQAPIYNTVDASLWYIIAGYQYYEATGDLDFITREILPVMEKIITSYAQGTDYEISMDQDGLIRAGSGLDQVTWMDVRFNNEVITPRHGKPVEINALWYNALKIMAVFAKDRVDEYEKMADKARNSFQRRFWNKDAGCLYDVVDPDDPTIRPNQLFALSLPFPLFAGRKAQKIIRIAELELEDIYGIRSLAKSDPRYVPEYSGNLEKRDRAYHMGTAWGFLFGTYLEGYLKAYRFSKQAYFKVGRTFLRLETHLDSGCLNGYAEVFDGSDGTRGKGCFNQAWSVGEILRVYRKYGFSERGDVL